MKTSKFRGHVIEFIDNEWVYRDTKEPTVETWKERTCGHCDLHFTEDGHDGCLGTLKGIMNACCGHGQDDEAYVQFMDGSGVWGEDAVVILNILKKNKD